MNYMVIDVILYHLWKTLGDEDVPEAVFTSIFLNTQKLLLNNSHAQDKIIITLYCLR